MVKNLWLFIGLFSKDLVFSSKVIKAFTAALLFILNLQSVLIYSQLMSTKSKFPAHANFIQLTKKNQ